MFKHRFVCSIISICTLLISHQTHCFHDVTVTKLKTFCFQPAEYETFQIRCIVVNIYINCIKYQLGWLNHNQSKFLMTLILKAYHIFISGCKAFWKHFENRNFRWIIQIHFFLYYNCQGYVMFNANKCFFLS
jgi:hypothetical protein